MPASVMTYSLPPLRFRKSTSVSRMPASATRNRPGSSISVTSRPARGLDHAAREALTSAGASVVVRHGEAAADVEVLDVRRAVRPHARRAARRVARAPRRTAPTFAICDPMCMSSPTSCRFGRSRDLAGHARHVVERDAELVPLLARADVLVRVVDGDLRIHAQRHGRDDARARARRASSSSSSPSLSTLMNSTPAASASSQLARLLADAAEHDVAAREARLARAIQLSARHDVHAGALGLQQAEHREVRVRLHAVVHAVRHAARTRRPADGTAGARRPRCRRTSACPPPAR